MLDGILVVNKPQGMTSHDVVARLRRVYQTKKIGHTGTLDPMVEGVLVLCFGKATKLSNILMAGMKTYHVTILLGKATDTEDITGAVVATEDVTKLNFDEQQIQETLNAFLGTYQQQVPLYAAVKVDGKKLYQYAREQKEVVRPIKTLHIANISYESGSLKRVEAGFLFSFTVTGSKGLYARTLCVDIGKKLGSCATMAKLTRTRSGNYDIHQALPLDEVMTQKPPLIPIRSINFIQHVVEVEPEVAAKLKVGYKLPKYFVEDTTRLTEQFLVRDKETTEVIGIFEADQKNSDKYRSVRIL